MDEPEFIGENKQPPGEEPLGEHVFGSVADENIVRHILYGMFQFLKIGGPSIFSALRVSEYKVAETEFFLDIVGQLHEQCP